MEISNSLTLDISKYKANLDKSVAQTNAAMGKISQSFAGIKTAFTGLLTAAAVKGAIGLAESYQQTAATIKNATSSIAEFNYSQQATFQSAQKLGLPFEQMASSVTALLPPMKAIGASTKTVQTFAETLQAGFKANAFKGGDAVITALAKSFNKGTIDAKAFQQTLIAIPDLASNIGKQLGLTEQQVKALGVAGKLSSKDFITAVTALNKEYNKQAENTNTLANSYNYLKNAIAQYLNGVNQTSGFTAKLGKGIKLVADNIDILAKGFTLIAGLKIAQMIGGIVAPVISLGAAVANSARVWAAETVAIAANTKAKTANALVTAAQARGINTAKGMNAAGLAITNAAGLMGGGFAGVTNALKGILSFLGKGGILAAVAAVIALTGEWQNTLDSVKYIFNDLKEFSGMLWNSAKAGIAAMTEKIKEFVNNSDSLKGFFDGFDSGIFGIFEMVGRLADNTVSGIKAAIGVLIQNITAAVKLAYNVMMKPIKTVFELIEKSMNKVIGLYNKIAETKIGEKMGLNAIDKIDLSGITDKLELSVDFAGLDDLKDLFKTYQAEQKQYGLENYFRQMKADIDNQRQIAESLNAEKDKELSNFSQFNDNFSDLNTAFADKVKDLKGVNGKTATEMQIEIEKLYNDTDFSKRDNDFYKKIDELTTAIGNQRIDWNAVSQAMGIGISSNVGAISTPIAATDMTTLSNKVTAQTTALQENTSALNNLNLQTAQNLQAVTPQGERPIVVKVIGNIDNMKEFISVVFDEKIGQAALMNA